MLVNEPVNRSNKRLALTTAAAATPQMLVVPPNVMMMESIRAMLDTATLG